MSLLRNIASGIRSLLQRKKIEEELDEELSEFLAMATEAKMKQGMSRKDALRAVRLERGSSELTKEVVRAAGWESFLETSWRDLHFAARVLRKSPAFTIIVVVTLALAIGANTAIFSLINTIALRNLPVPNPEQLVLLQWTARHEPQSNFNWGYGGCPGGRGDSSSLPTDCSFSYPMFERVRSMGDLFSGVFSYAPATADLRVERHHERVNGMYVSGEFFSTLGAQAAVGRTLNADDDVAGAEPVMVLSYRYWQSELGGDAAVVGRTATVNLKPVLIVGITSHDFPDLNPGIPVNFWMSLATQSIVSQKAENSLWLSILTRLRPGVKVRRAQAELNAMFVPITTTGPAAIFKPDDAPRITLLSAANGLASLRTEYRRPLGALMAAVGLILLLASANVAGLALARSSVRQKEMAVRNALGAPRLRIVRQLLTESLMLSFAGGSLGILLAEFAAKALVSFLSSNSHVPLDIDVGIDWHVFGFTMLVSTAVGLLFGLAPALRGSRIDVAPALKLSGGPASTTPLRSSRLSNVLVVAQVVISLLVLLGAGLLGRTVLNLEGANAGFKTGNLLLFNVDMTASGLKIDDPRCDKLNEELQNRFAALPGVKSVSYSIMPLLSGGYSASPFSLPGTPVSSAHPTYVLLVGSRFFETMGIPLVGGRTFTRADFESSAKPKPIVVSGAFTRAFFGDENPLGRRVIEGDSGPDAVEWQIIGVVGDTKNESVRSEIEPTAFEPDMYRLTTFELRTQNNPNALASLVREAAGQVNPDYLILDMMTQKEEIDRTIYQERLTATLSTLFGLLALTLSVIGLYGLVTYGVARRTHEIGMRIALGAERHQVLWLTARLGFVLTLVGVIIGLGAAFGVTRYLRSLLYGVRPTDPWTFAGIAILLAFVGAVGSYIPARRAMRVDPVVALRYE